MNMVKYRFYYEIIVSGTPIIGYLVSYTLKIDIGEGHIYSIFDIDVSEDCYSICMITRYRINYILKKFFNDYKKMPCKFIIDLNKSIKMLTYSIPQQNNIIKNLYLQKSMINKYIKEHYIRMDV